jgi:hypothetical protein
MTLTIRIAEQLEDFNNSNRMSVSVGLMCRSQRTSNFQCGHQTMFISLASRLPERTVINAEGRSLDW